MKVYFNGIILLASQPAPIKRVDGTAVLDKNGAQMYIQTVTMQHEFQTQTGNGFNKYITFDIIANSTNRLISQLNIQPNEEMEVALDFDSKPSQDGRWFNSARCSAVERDKSKWHRPVVQRVAVMPGQQQAINHVQPSYAQPAAPQYAAPQPSDQGDQLPF